MNTILVSRHTRLSAKPTLLRKMMQMGWFTVVSTLINTGTVVAAEKVSGGWRWQISDDTGWQATYERVGTTKTLEELPFETYVELVDGGYRDGSILELSVYADGRVVITRRDPEMEGSCVYSGRLSSLGGGPLVHGDYRQSAVAEGEYRCDTPLTSGKWSASVQA